jgi:5'-phosphate synthase pdxT subunit
VTPTIGVLALQGDVREHLTALARVGAAGRAVRREAELDGLHGIVLPGGESTTMDKLMRAFGLRDPLRAALGAGLPAYGSCAGMILLADRVLDGPADQETLGGIDMTVRRNAFGRQVASFEGDVEMAGVAGGPLHGVFIRAPWVEDVGPEVEVLAHVALEGEHADDRRLDRRAHQPRSASRCGSGISSTLMPTIASPRPRETLATTSGSS